MASQPDPLQAALESSFSSLNLPYATATPAQQAQEATTIASTHVSRPSLSAEALEEVAAARDDSWKTTLSEHDRHWKEDNARRRLASEKTRAMYEELGETVVEAKTGIPSSLLSGGDADGVLVGTSIADAGDLVHGEGQGGHGIDALNQVLSPHVDKHHVEPTAHGRQVSSSNDDPADWTQVPSVASSYPSMSFPDTPPTTYASKTLDDQPLSSGQPHHHHHQHQPQRQNPPPPPVAPPSVTLSIFDSSLSTRARVLALASSLTINLFLPFVNGVMLGFGEIFAKSIIAWDGWGNVASTLGLRSASASRQPRK